MASINHVILAGNLTADPTIRNAPTSGLSVSRMRIAVNRRRKNGNEVAYVTLVALGKTAEFANEHMRKGSATIVHGRLQTRNYTQDGESRTAVEVLVNEVQLLDRKSGAITASVRDESTPRRR